MADELRDAVTAAYEKEEQNAPPSDTSTTGVPQAGNTGEPVAPPLPTPDTPIEPPAGEPGTQQSPPEAPPAAPPQPGTKTEEAAGAQEESAGRAHRVDRPPQSWRVEARIGWADLPISVRQEIHRRESLIDKTIAETAPLRAELEQFKQVVQPYAARIQSLGATPTQAAAMMFQADYVLATAPKAQRAQFMAKLIKDYEIDIALLDDALVGKVQQQQAVQPADIQQLVQQQVMQALAPMYQQQLHQEQQIQQRADMTVEQMSLDPKFPYFEDLRNDMADLMEMAAKRGAAISLEQAYNKAYMLSPMAAQQQQQSQAQNAHRRAQAAQAASSSVGGAPASGGSQQFVGNGTLRGDIEAAFANYNVES
jgi:hypothetical protein